MVKIWGTKGLKSASAPLGFLFPNKFIIIFQIYVSLNFSGTLFLAGHFKIECPAKYNVLQKLLGMCYMRDDSTFIRQQQFLK